MHEALKRTSYSSDEDWFTNLRELFLSDKEAFRRKYSDLITEVADLLWAERVLREKVLLWDHPSVVNRLWGAQLAEYTRGRKIPEVCIPSTVSMEDVSIDFPLLTLAPVDLNEALRRIKAGRAELDGLETLVYDTLCTLAKYPPVLRESK